MRTLKLGITCCVLLLVAGCFPIELDVNSTGQIVIPRAEGFFLYNSADGKTSKVLGNDLGKPVFARFSPNGKDLLAVVEKESGFLEFEFFIVPLSGGKPRSIFKGEKTAYVRFSPDGNQLAISSISAQEDPVLKAQVPEIRLINVKDGSGEDKPATKKGGIKTKSPDTTGASDGGGKLLAKKVGVLTRWFPDSKRLLTFNIDKKDDDSNFYGNICTIDIATGKATPLCAAVGDQSFHFDLSPDGKTVVFTAYDAGKAGTTLPKSSGFKKLLFQLDVASGKLIKSDKEASYAFFSPDGKKLALGTAPEGFNFDRLKLEVCPVGKFNESKTITENSHKPIAIGGGGGMFPGWINNDTLFYFVEKAVYGKDAKSVHMVVTSEDGSKRKDVQPVIDTVASANE